MDFTALHRLLGLEPTPLTDDLLEQAVANGLEETDDLDWKSELPAEKELARSDFPKDVAAMANSGGGLIVYGVTESERRATGRVDVGEVGENYERTLRRVAVSGIHPPVFGLDARILGADSRRALAVIVPASVDGPHLVYRGEHFGAPVRNHADTEWMKERQLEANYRARFADRRAAQEALSSLYEEVATSRPVHGRAWMFGVARPRARVGVAQRMSRDDAREILSEACRFAPAYTEGGGMHPLETVEEHNPKPGLRRWVAPPTNQTPESAWKEAWASVHDDGSVTLSAAIGAARTPDGHEPAWQVRSERAEGFVADLMALLRASSHRFAVSEYELIVGIEWDGAQPLQVMATDQPGSNLPDVSMPLVKYQPVTTTVWADAEFDDFLGQLWELATDVVNQGGVQFLKAISPPALNEE